MANINFMAVAKKELEQQNNTYINSRYAPVGNEKVGKPFPAYKEFGGRLTDNRPAGSVESVWKKEFNLPTNNNFFRTSVIGDAINLGNTANASWVYQTQTLSNAGNYMLCNSTSDCEALPGTTCNRNYENWPDAHGNQTGAFCSTTFYPELRENNMPVGSGGGGVYNRLTVNQGGIGRECYNNSDCGSGYECNNEYDIYGSNIQQTGYCAMKYQCPDGTTKFLGTPYNSSIPQPPPPQQNMNGQGYPSKEMCTNEMLAQQDCVRANNGRWYAVYPGYCSIPSNLRTNGQKYSSVRTTGYNELKQGFKIPSFATNRQSNMGGSNVQAFQTTWNTSSSLKNENGSEEAFQYSMAMNPIPKNLY